MTIHFKCSDNTSSTVETLATPVQEVVDKLMQFECVTEVWALKGSRKIFLAVR